MNKVFIIEDDHALRSQLVYFLEGYGYHCCFSEDFSHIISLALAENADLILLDINLPCQDGYHICREIRKASMVPIIIITSRATDMDELMSMNLGADDFVSKPFNTQILLARMAALLRRQQAVQNTQYMEHHGLKFYLEKGVVEAQGGQANLTKNERHILSLLFKHRDCIVSRESFMEELWQSDEFIDENTLTVNVNRLRRKLSDLGAENIIKTHRGQGYSL